MIRGNRSVTGLKARGARCCQDRQTVKFFSVRPHPGLPDPGQRKQSLVFILEEVGCCLSRRMALPFIKACHRNKAAPIANRILERRLRFNRFPARRRNLRENSRGSFTQSGTKAHFIRRAVRLPYSSTMVSTGSVGATLCLGGIGCIPASSPDTPNSSIKSTSSAATCNLPVMAI